MSVTNKTVVNRFPQYSYKNVRVENPSEEIIKKDDGSLLETIFAPDPVTGIPRSDLPLVMSRDTSPEVSQYITQTLLQPLPSSSCGDDADLALDMVKSPEESTVAYYDRIKEIISKDTNQNSKTD